MSLREISDILSVTNNCVQAELKPLQLFLSPAPPPPPSLQCGSPHTELPLAKT